jgi:hypothetical protein
MSHKRREKHVDEKNKRGNASQVKTHKTGNHVAATHVMTVNTNNLNMKRNFFLSSFSSGVRV